MVRAIGEGSQTAWTAADLRFDDVLDGILRATR